MGPLKPTCDKLWLNVFVVVQEGVSNDFFFQIEPEQVQWVSWWWYETSDEILNLECLYRLAAHIIIVFSCSLWNIYIFIIKGHLNQWTRLKTVYLHTQNKMNNHQITTSSYKYFRTLSENQTHFILSLSLRTLKTYILRYNVVKQKYTK